ncbi:hypothetical protein IC582_024463 [Cucumis melo]|uniref:MLP-like protein 328 n=1 Tax=Cucumis melo TaxID=3656 RepID=A0A1S3BNV3_CUCME|nr:MLP-like protein 328 [Cucumis melo]
MTLAGKLVSEVEINTPPHRFYKLFKEQIASIPNISPNLIQNVQIHDGDWSKHGHGSIKLWNYTIDNRAEVVKERVEFDDKKLVIRVVGLEGDVFEHYKTFIGTYQVIPKGPNRSGIIFTLEYEKLRDGPPYPQKYHEAMNSLAKDIEAHLK